MRSLLAVHPLQLLPIASSTLLALLKPCSPSVPQFHVRSMLPVHPLQHHLIFFSSLESPLSMPLSHRNRFAHILAQVQELLSKTGPDLLPRFQLLWYHFVTERNRDRAENSVHLPVQLPTPLSISRLQMSELESSPPHAQRLAPTSQLRPPFPELAPLRFP